jgi:AcrR family transcriptional regulator
MEAPIKARQRARGQVKDSKPHRKANVPASPPDGERDIPSVYGLPADDPISSLPPTAQALLSGARTVVARDGLAGLTIDAIVAETGVNRAAIRYYFGSKDGLLAALVDSLLHDTAASLLKQTSSLPQGRERLRLCMEGAQTIAEDTEAYGIFFSILPETMRDDDLRSRLANLYEFFREVNLRYLGTDGEKPARDLNALAVLLVALTDGLGIQRFLEPDRTKLEFDRALELFARALEHVLIELEGT